jgi:hypothetical protein
MANRTDHRGFAIRKRAAKKIAPYLTINHRFGHVFVRVVYMERGFRNSKVLRLEPAKAAAIAADLAKCAKAAKPKLKLVQS